MGLPALVFIAVPLAVSGVAKVLRFAVWLKETKRAKTSTDPGDALSYRQIAGAALPDKEWDKFWASESGRILQQGIARAKFEEEAGLLQPEGEGGGE